MSSDYIERSLEPILKRAIKEFPAVILTGPRQSGKTTVLKRLFGGSHRYLSLELPDVQQAAMQDPRGFLQLHGPPVIYDEIQYAPDLLHYVKELVDERRDQPGQFVLSGSQNLLLMQSVVQTLAGRAAVLRLLPLSLREIAGRPQTLLPWETGEQRPSRQLSLTELWEVILKGGYPELHKHANRDVHLWHASYVQTYLERDIRSIRQVGDLTEFQKFVRLLAARSTGLLNMAGLARDLGVAQNTVKAWLSVLEATYQVIVLRPFHANVGKRMVKAPKVFFTDVGTLCYLVGLRDAMHAMEGPMAGAIMESVVLSEIIRTQTHRGLDPRLFFFRTSSGTEVDIVVEEAGKLIPIEVKLSATPKPAMAAGIRAFQALFEGEAARGYVVHPGGHHLPLDTDVVALPLAAL